MGRLSGCDDDDGPCGCSAKLSLSFSTTCRWTCEDGGRKILVVSGDADESREREGTHLAVHRARHLEQRPREAKLVHKVGRHDED